MRKKSAFSSRPITGPRWHLTPRRPPERPERMTLRRFDLHMPAESIPVRAAHAIGLSDGVPTCAGCPECAQLRHDVIMTRLTLSPIRRTPPQRFNRKSHIDFILGLDKKTDTFEYHVTEHLRMSGIYWGATCMALMGELEKMDKKKIVKFVFDCQHSNGGFSGNINHDPHLLYTLSAVQILALFGELDKLDKDKTAQYVANLQQKDGSFSGDKWNEIDTRFSYCALNCLTLLGKTSLIDVKKATEFVNKCRNFDGGFGAVPGAESHAGQIFCCVGALALGGAMQYCDANLLGWWLAERQLPCGGLNGRPEKKEDVCYSWWVLSALSILGKVPWISREKLAAFILKCQGKCVVYIMHMLTHTLPPPSHTHTHTHTHIHTHTHLLTQHLKSQTDEKEGGISDRPENMPDVFHTFFGVAALSLLGYPNFKKVDPVFALPEEVIQKLGIKRLYP